MWCLLRGPTKEFLIPVLEISFLWNTTDCQYPLFHVLCGCFKSPILQDRGKNLCTRHLDLEKIYVYKVKCFQEIEICFGKLEKLRKLWAWENVKNKKFFKAEIMIFKEVLSLNPKNHILIKKRVYSSASNIWLWILYWWHGNIFVIFYEVLSLNPKNHILIKKRVYIKILCS